MYSKILTNFYTKETNFIPQNEIFNSDNFHIDYIHKPHKLQHKNLPFSFLSQKIKALILKIPPKKISMPCFFFLPLFLFIISHSHSIAVRLGDYNLASDPDCVLNDDMKMECAENVQEITEIKPLRHEYHYAKVFEDIALIKLNEPAKLHQDNINTICLPFTENEIGVDDTFYITGWGRIDNNNTFSEVLLGTYVQYVTQEECKKTITSTLTSKHICAGSDGEESIKNV